MVAGLLAKQWTVKCTVLSLMAHIRELAPERQYMFRRTIQSAFNLFGISVVAPHA